MLVPTGALIAVGLTLTVLAGPIFSYSDRAAAEVLDRASTSRRCWAATTMRRILLTDLGPVLAGAGVDSVVGHRFCGEHPVRAGGRPGDHLLLPLPVVPVEGRLHPLSLLRLILTVGYYLVLSRCRWRCSPSSPDRRRCRRCCGPTSP